jgi:hypothetical protein
MARPKRKSTSDGLKNPLTFEKCCSKCGAIKLAVEFYANGVQSDGRNKVCIDCAKVALERARAEKASHKDCFATNLCLEFLRQPMAGVCL